MRTFPAEQPTRSMSSIAVEQYFLLGHFVGDGGEARGLVTSAKFRDDFRFHVPFRPRPLLRRTGENSRSLEPESECIAVDVRFDLDKRPEEVFVRQFEDHPVDVMPTGLDFYSRVVEKRRRQVVASRANAASSV